MKAMELAFRKVLSGRALNAVRKAKRRFQYVSDQLEHDLNVELHPADFDKLNRRAAAAERAVRSIAARQKP